MSRIGNSPIKLPDGVSVQVEGKDPDPHKGA